jgi:hypothetical protein
MQKTVDSEKTSQHEDDQNALISPSEVIARLPGASDETFYQIDAAPDKDLRQDEEEDDANLLATAYIPPFQLTNPLTQLASSQRNQPSATSRPVQTKDTPRRSISPGRFRPSFTLVGGIVTTMVILGAILFPFLTPQAVVKSSQATNTVTIRGAQTQQTARVRQQSSPPTQATPASPAKTAQAKQTPAKKTKANTQQAQAPSPTTFPLLPTGWTAAGLGMPDELDAQDTAGVIFTAREERLDYRDIGSRAIHAGTLTAAKTFLTDNAKMRFVHNDIRVINNVLFDRLTNLQEQQRPRNIEAHLARFQELGQQQFVWMDVTFFLWQSKLDVNGQRTEGYDPDPATGQPRLHHMSVLLLRVPPQDQGPNAAAGGTGWLVSNYGLDLTTPLSVVQPA